MGQISFFLGAQVLLATALWSGIGGADRTHAVEPAALRSARPGLILAQTFHTRPGVPGSSGSDDLRGASGGTHAPPPVPNFSGSGSGSGASPSPPAVSNGAGSSHAAPGLPSFSDDSGHAPAQSHAPPAPNGAGASHAAPGVPMMGGNP